MSPYSEAVVACPVCGELEPAPVLEATDVRYHVPGWWQVMECSRCSVAYLSRWPVDDAAVYPGQYTQHDSPLPSGPGTSNVKRAFRSSVLAAEGYPTGLGGSASPRFLTAAGSVLRQVPFLRALAEWKLPVFPQGRPGGRLLDFGCGNGAFLKIMENLGWEVYGIERDEFSAGLARSSGLRVHPDIDDCPVEPRSIDVVTLNHAIEHVRDPIGTLARLRPFMAPDGVVGMATPNWNSVTRRLFGGSWYALDPPRHLMLHTAKSLRWVCKEAGLEPQRIYSSSAREGARAWQESFGFATGRPPSTGLAIVSILPQLLAGPLGAGEELVAWARNPG